MHKRPRTQRELKNIASQLGVGWVKGDPIAPFLRRLLPVIDRLVHEENVSLRDIAKALGMARITYQTGNPWTEQTLQKKLSEARIKFNEVGAQAMPPDRGQSRISTPPGHRAWPVDQQLRPAARRPVSRPSPVVR